MNAERSAAALVRLLAGTPTRDAVRAAVALAVCAALAICSALRSRASAQATQIATISAGFSPMRLGAHATVSFGFANRTPDGSLPSALTGLEFHYPPSLGLGTNELGLASCDPGRLSFYGPRGCPPNSIMGGGSALAKFQVSPEISEEGASIALVAGPSRGGYVNMLISATGTYPVAARIVMRTELLPGRLKFSVPLVGKLPEGPDVAVVQVHVNIGGHLTYYERRHGKMVPYRPKSVVLPKRCPRDGFNFSATFSFLDGTVAEARTAVACPQGR